MRAIFAAVAVAMALTSAPSLAGETSEASESGESGELREDFDPTVADDDVKSLRAKGHDQFCKRPERPLTPRAHALCEIARDIPDCDGFVAACDQEAAKKSPFDEKPDDSRFEFGAFLAELFRVLVYALLAAGIVALLVAVGMAILKWQRDRSASDAPPRSARSQEDDVLAVEVPRETDAERLLALADAHLAKGELDRAVITYLHAALRALDQRGAIRVAKHRTNGEYVRACTDPNAMPPLRSIVRAVDRVAFRGETPTSQAVGEVSRLARALVRAVPVAMMALMLTLTGCGPGVGGWSDRNGDPAGMDMMESLLEKQGLKVSRVPTSLAKIPLPKPEEEAPPTLIVDAERTTLEEDATEHLARWVEAGGVLVIAGEPEAWPQRFLATRGPSEPGREVVVSVSIEGSATPASAEDAYVAKAHVARAPTLMWATAEPLATVDHGLYAGARALDKGMVLGLSSGELFTNASLAVPGNAEALVALLSAVARSGSIQVAHAEDGIAPADNPISALQHAHLGLALWHALAAFAIMVVAVGVRHARARPTPPPRRRAFTEHVEATGAAYARARMSGHALAAFARYADERLRAKMPRGSHDPAAFLAARSGADPSHVAALWARANAATTATQLKGDLQTLRELTALYQRAMKSD